MKDNIDIMNFELKSSPELNLTCLTYFWRNNNIQINKNAVFSLFHSEKKILSS